jgi:hypothetical protein
LRKATLALVFLAAAMIFLILIPVNLKKVQAAGDYVITHVDQNVSIMYNGYIVLNDTIQVSGQIPASFEMGFPHVFNPYLVSGQAFDTNNPSSTFPVTLNVPLEDRSGYSGIRIDFSGKTPQVFSLEVLLTNDLIFQNSQNASIYTLVFPEFPSLTQDVNTFNGSVTLPTSVSYVSGTIGQLTYGQDNLTALAYNVSQVTFYAPNLEIQLFDVDQLNRRVGINEFGSVTTSDTYYITNKGSSSISSVDVWLPDGASNIVAVDQLGRTMSAPTQIIASASRYSLNLTRAIASALSSIFVVNYGLPSGNYVSKQGNSFNVNMSLFGNLDYYVNGTSVSFVLPEGARIQTVSDTLSGVSLDLHRDVFQDSVTLATQGISELKDFSVDFSYEYSSLWAAFRPTIWAMVFALIGFAAVIIVRRPKTPSSVMASASGTVVRPEQLRSFVVTYEERMKILREMDLLEDKARKGRIPRQRYKVQRKTFETRLESSARNLVELKARIQSAGGHYGNLMRQLEIAEAQLSEVEANVKTIEDRHSHGELSLEAYRKLEGDYLQRKEKAETSINGILLRLREEIR